MKHDIINHENKVKLIVTGKEHWVPAVPYPLMTAKGLPFWKKANEKYWRPVCRCGQLFNTLDDYNAHVLFWNSVYGIALQQARGEWVTPPKVKPAPEPITKEEETK